MPDRDGQHMYRIKSPFEEYERAVKEDVLAKSDGYLPEQVPARVSRRSSVAPPICNSRKRLGSNKSDHQFRFRPLNGFSLRFSNLQAPLCLAGFCLSRPRPTSHRRERAGRASIWTRGCPPIGFSVAGPSPNYLKRSLERSVGSMCHRIGRSFGSDRIGQSSDRTLPANPSNSNRKTTETRRSKSHAPVLPTAPRRCTPTPALPTRGWPRRPPCALTPPGGKEFLGPQNPNTR